MVESCVWCILASERQLPDLVEKLFTPLFSTKADGMGMGLNICRSIVELHGGRIWSEPANPGCTFRFSIPQVRP